MTAAEKVSPAELKADLEKLLELAAEVAEELDPRT